MTVGQRNRTLAERARHANAVIEAVAAHGPRFFHYARTNATAQFEITRSGRLTYRDEMTARAFVPDATKRWPSFSQSGEVRSLVIALTRYVRDGAPAPSRLLDLPGYDPRERDRVKRMAETSPAISERD